MMSITVNRDEPSETATFLVSNGRDSREISISEQSEVYDLFNEFLNALYFAGDR